MKYNSLHPLFFVANINTQKKELRNMHLSLSTHKFGLNDIATEVEKADRSKL